MKVQDCMSGDVCLIAPTDTIQKAASYMKSGNIGYIPVTKDDRIVGAITDRDIVVRAVAEGKSADTLIKDVMTASVYYCFEDQNVDEVAKMMADLHVRRMPVVSRAKRLVGVVSLGDLSRTNLESNTIKTTYQQLTAH